MIAQETIRQLKTISIAERLYLMEILLESLKNDIKKNEPNNQPSFKKFTVRPFNLGQEINADREIIYAERGL